MTLTELQNRAGQRAKDSGFRSLDRSFGDKLMLIVSELSEALEEYRKGHKPNEIYYVSKCTCKEADEWCQMCHEPPKPEGIPVEIADAIIRIGDLADEYEFDLNGVVKEKMDYNNTRSFRHGGKLL